MPHDAQLAAALSVHAERLDDVPGVEVAEHVALQAASLHALLDGKYDGDLTVGELLAHGDHGLGTLNGLDGELTIVDGEAWQAAADGSVNRVSPAAKTPFAVVTRLGDVPVIPIEGPLAHDDLLALLDDHLPAGARNALIRLDGHFTRIHARSVPCQTRPYRPLSQVADDMVEWTWHDIEATVIGFRFDAGAEGLEIVGHHMHVVSAQRDRSGHVLGLDIARGSAMIEAITDLHCELPPGVDLVPGGGPLDAAALDAIETEHDEAGRQ